MAGTRRLLELYNSLTKSEKQAITVERNKKKATPNYLVLYDWLENELKGNIEAYDRAVFRASKDSKWDGRAVETAEGNLYDKILEVLSFKHLEKKSTTLINQYLAESEILKSKGLYEGSLERLKKAEKITYTHHKHALLTEIIPKKIDVILLTNHAKRKGQIRQLSDQLKEAASIVQQEAEYRNLNVNLVVQFQESRDPEKIEIFLKERYFSIINRGFPTQGSFYSQYYFYSTQAIWCRLHRNYPKAYTHQKEVVKLWQNNKTVREENTQLYITQLANLINYAVIGEIFDGAQQGIDWMKELKTRTKDEAAEKNQDLLFYQQYLLLNQHKFEAAQKLVPEIEALLARFSKKDYKRINPSRLYNFYYNTLVNLLICQDYSKAALWLKKLETLKSYELRKDLQQLARILQLIINYGLQSNEFSHNMFRRLYKDQKFVQALSPFEQVIYTFFKKMINSPEFMERKSKHLPKLRQELEALSDGDKKVLGYIDVMLWIDSYL